MSERAAEYVPAFRAIVEKCSILDSYYIPTRYPNGLPDAIAPDVYDAATGHSAPSMAKTTIDMAAAEIRGGWKGRKTTLEKTDGRADSWIKQNCTVDKGCCKWMS